MEIRRTHSLTWSNIFGAVVVSLGTLILLYAIGLSAGMSLIDFDSDGTLRSAGLFTGVFSVVAALVALFCGGLVAGIGAGSMRSGALHGVTLWGLTAVIACWGATALVTSTLSGGAKLTSSVMGAASDAVGGGLGAVASSGPALGDLAGTLKEELQDQVSLDDMLEAINARRGNQKPVTAAQLENAARTIGRQVTLGRSLSASDIEAIVVKKTGISQEEARKVAREVETRVEQAKKTMDEARQNAMAYAERAKHEAEDRAKELGEQAANGLAKASMGIAGMLAAALLAAVGGSLAGAALRLRENEVEVKSAVSYRAA